METVEVSHREIYDRLIAVEAKVDDLKQSTDSVVKAFDAAHGAFTALEWLARLAKPILMIGALIGAIGVAWSNFKGQ